MKKIIAILMLMVLMATAAACSSKQPEQEKTGDEAPEKEACTIAVLVYNRTDDEVLAFKNYLEGYIAKEFDVNFLYSDSISSGKEALEFISEAAEYGARGVMSFSTYDLKKEVELCESKGMYFMLGSGTVTKKAFESVQDNKYFLGAAGPGDEMEYMAGANLAENAIKNSKGSRFLILSGGNSLGNEMHRLRTQGIIEKLESAYGTKIDLGKDLADLKDPVTFVQGDLEVCVCPGYLTDDYSLAQIRKELSIRVPDYDYVLSVLPATQVMDDLEGIKLGVIDCYSENNLRYFINGKINYVAGKYASLIGPSFAAMYNAVTGHADVFRDNGRAFQLKQGFWLSDSREDYEEKYSLAGSIENCAYNYEDIQKVLTEYDPDATFEDLEDLAEAYTYDDAVKRRG